VQNQNHISSARADTRFNLIPPPYFGCYHPISHSAGYFPRFVSRTPVYHDGFREVFFPLEVFQTPPYVFRFIEGWNNSGNARRGLKGGLTQDIPLSKNPPYQKPIEGDIFEELEPMDLLKHPGNVFHMHNGEGEENGTMQVKPGPRGEKEEKWGNQYQVPGVKGTQQKEQTTDGQVRTPQWFMNGQENDGETHCQKDCASPNHLRSQKGPEQYGDRVIVMHDRSEGHEGGEEAASRFPKGKIESKQGPEEVEALSPILSVHQKGYEKDGKVFTHDRATQGEEPQSFPLLGEKQEAEADKEALDGIEMAFPCHVHEHEGIQGVKDEPAGWKSIPTQQEGQHPDRRQIEEQDEDLEEQRRRGNEGPKPEEQHREWGITSRGIFMVNTGPDFVDERLQHRVVRGMEIRVEAVVQDGAFPDIAVDIVGCGVRKKCHPYDEGHREDHDQLDPWGIISGKGSKEEQQKEERKEVEGPEEAEMSSDGAEEGH
jgi:hypothetical protein